MRSSDDVVLSAGCSGLGRRGESESVSIAATALLVVAVVTLLARHALFANSPVAIVVRGPRWRAHALGAVDLRRAELSLPGANPTAGGVITTGPYRFIRHPIYAAILCLLWAAVLSRPSAVNALWSRSRRRWSPCASPPRSACFSSATPSTRRTARSGNVVVHVLF